MLAIFSDPEKHVCWNELMTKFRFLFERDEFWHPAAGVGIKFTLVGKDVVHIHLLFPA